MPERYQQIMGTELEWALSVKMQNQPYRQLADDIGSLVERYLQEDVIRVSQTSASAAGMMSNGSRYYVDVGSHLEYATPENTDAEGVVISELASERLIAESLRRYIARKHGAEAVMLQKRLIDDNLNMWGYHINISEDRRQIDDFDEYIQPLTMHYAAGLPLFGAGAVYSERVDGQKVYKYSFGQKSLKLSGDILSSTTYNAKPIINTRDEPYAYIPKNRRIHIVGNDPHISPWAARMAIATYSLLLTAARQKKLPCITPADGQAWQMAQQVAVDLDCRNIYDVTINGSTKSMTICDIEREYIEAVKKVDILTAGQLRDLAEWERAVDDMEQDIMLLRRRSDGVAKLALIRAKLSRDGKDENGFDVNSANIDKDYGTIFRATKKQALQQDTATLLNSTTPAKLRARWFLADMPSEERIIDAVINPPSTTRAYARGNAIRQGNVTHADWGGYKIGNNVTKLEPLDGRQLETA